MKPAGYHINPILRKKEEELHMKNMEKKIRAAKSSIPMAARGGQAVTSGGKSKKGQDKLRPDELDGLIQARLKDILGDTLIQDIQSMVRQGYPAPRGTGSGADSAKGLRSAPRPPRRPQWNEEWSVPPALEHTQTSRPSAGRAPAPASTTTRSPSAPHRAVGTPEKARTRMQSSDCGQAAKPEPRPSVPKPPPSRKLPPAAPSARVQLLSHVSSPAGSPKQPGTATRYSGLPPPTHLTASPSSRGSGARAAPDALTHSDAHALALLNPDAVPAKPGVVGAGAARSPLLKLSVDQPSLDASAASPGFQRAPSSEHYNDPNLMSLSRLSVAQSPGAHATSQRRLFSASPRVGPAASTASLSLRLVRESESVAKEEDQHVAAAEEDQYDDDFEAVDEERLEEASHGNARPPANGSQVDALRQSVALLKDLVQMKINALGSTCHEDDDGDGFDMCLEGPPGEAGLEPLDQSLALMGGDTELRHSSVLVPGRGGDQGLLHQSDLDYLEQFQAGEKAEDFGDESNADNEIEAAGPVGDTSAWGSRLSTKHGEKEAGSRGAHNGPGVGAGSGQAASPPPSNSEALEDIAVKASLAIEAKALFTSLRQLHQLMSGPKGCELSPRRETGPPSSSGFSMPSTPTSASDKRLEDLRGSASKEPSPVQEEAFAMATFGPQVLTVGEMDPEDGPSSGLPGIEGAAGTQLVLTPKNQLCAADVQWMASLMNTLSASMQGLDDAEWQHGVDLEDMLPGLEY